MLVPLTKQQKHADSDSRPSIVKPTFCFVVKLWCCEKFDFISLFFQKEVVELEQLKPSKNDEVDVDIHDNSFNATHFGNPPQISFLEFDEKPSLGPESSSELLPVPQCSRKPRNSRIMNPLLKTPTPRKKRIILRDVIMFLVISNSCLWMLLSLNGTAFKVYSYQSDYFGHSAWTTLTSVTAPLSIFLKLHSAACFFEIWSYS